jgi:hypothetical protein
VTRDTISKFNRDTLWLATGVLGTVVFAALMLAFQERQPKATQAEGDLLLNANPATVAGVVSKSSNDKMASGEGSGVDHAFIETPPQEIPSSQTESAASTPVLALTPENRNAAQANPDSGTSALRQDSARSIGPEARNARNRSSVASRSIDVKRRLIQLWHQSLAIAKKSRSWTAFSNLNRGVNKKAAYTAETNH